MPQRNDLQLKSKPPADRSGEQMDESGPDDAHRSHSVVGLGEESQALYRTGNPLGV